MHLTIWHPEAKDPQVNKYLDNICYQLGQIFLQHYQGVVAGECVIVQGVEEHNSGNKAF